MTSVQRMLAKAYTAMHESEHFVRRRHLDLSQCGTQSASPSTIVGRLCPAPLVGTCSSASDLSILLHTERRSALVLLIRAQSIGSMPCRLVEDRRWPNGAPAQKSLQVRNNLGAANIKIMGSLLSDRHAADRPPTAHTYLTHERLYIQSPPWAANSRMSTSERGEQATTGSFLGRLQNLTHPCQREGHC